MTIFIVLLLTVLTFIFIIYPFFKQPSSSMENEESRDTYSKQSRASLSVATGTDDLKGDFDTEDEIEKQILKLRQSKKSSQSEDLDEAP